MGNTCVVEQHEHQPSQENCGSAEEEHIRARRSSFRGGAACPPSTSDATNVSLLPPPRVSTARQSTGGSSASTTPNTSASSAGSNNAAPGAPGGRGSRRRLSSGEGDAVNTMNAPMLLVATNPLVAPPTDKEVQYPSMADGCGGGAVTSSQPSAHESCEEPIYSSGNFTVSGPADDHELPVSRKRLHAADGSTLVLLDVGEAPENGAVWRRSSAVASQPMSNRKLSTTQATESSACSMSLETSEVTHVASEVLEGSHPPSMRDKSSEALGPQPPRPPPEAIVSSGGATLQVVAPSLSATTTTTTSTSSSSILLTSRRTHSTVPLLGSSMEEPGSSSHGIQGAISTSCGQQASLSSRHQLLSSENSGIRRTSTVVSMAPQTEFHQQSSRNRVQRQPPSAMVMPTGQATPIASTPERDAHTEQAVVEMLLRMRRQQSSSSSSSVLTFARSSHLMISSRGSASGGWNGRLPRPSSDDEEARTGAAGPSSGTVSSRSGPATSPASSGGINANGLASARHPQATRETEPEDIVEVIFEIC